MPCQRDRNDLQSHLSSLPLAYLETTPPRPRYLSGLELTYQVTKAVSGLWLLWDARSSPLMPSLRCPPISFGHQALWPAFPVHLSKSRRSSTSSFPLWAADVPRPNPLHRGETIPFALYFWAALLAVHGVRAPFLYHEHASLRFPRYDWLLVFLNKPRGSHRAGGKASQPCPPVH